MSTWTQLLQAFDSSEQRVEAARVLEQSLASLSHADAVKTLIALAPRLETDAQRQGVIEAMAQRLDGALAWNLAHLNRSNDQVRTIIDRAILLRIYSAPPEEEAYLLRRGLDEDPNLYGQLLLSAIRRHPIDAHRTVASYVVWQDNRVQSLGASKDSPWKDLRLQLEYYLGADLPEYIPALPLNIKDEEFVRKTLSAAAPGTELDVAYKLTSQTQGFFQDTIKEFLVSWAETQDNWEPLLSATDLPHDASLGKLARATLWELHYRVEPDIAATALHSALRWSTENPRPTATAFFLILLQQLARRRPTMELWKLAPLIKKQIANETRHSLVSRLRPGNVGPLTSTGELFADALQALHSHLPDPTLPQPVKGEADRALLPRPVEVVDFDAVSLPTPATEVLGSGSNPRWKRWTTKFKRS